jgi:guanylate kinase
MMNVLKIDTPDIDKRSTDFIHGRLYIISAPSGAGKTTLCRAVLDHFTDMFYSVSCTTREIRKGEQEGVDYHFISKDDFRKKIESDSWAEWVEVHGNYYGTDAGFINKVLAEGKSILLDIDVQGTRQILKKYPDAVTIFVMPPSPDILRERLEGRGTDGKDAIEKRLKNAEAEIANKDIFRHIVVNDRLSAAVAELISIIDSYPLTGTSPNVA